MAERDPADQLYDLCYQQADDSEEGYKKTFTQDDLLQLCQNEDSKVLQAVASVEKLLPLIARLTKESLVITHKTSTGSSWAMRPRKVANDIRSLGKDERMVFEVIEASHEEGAWIRQIKNKTGLKDTHSLEKLVAKLVRQKLVKSIKNVKAMHQKTYMLAYLAPSDTITGGSFYDAGVLDESLVDEVGNIIIFHVRANSWSEPYAKDKKIKKEKSPVLTRDGPEREAGPPDRKKRRTTSRAAAAVRTDDIEDLGAVKKAHKHSQPPADTQFAHLVGHSYPTPTSIHKYLIDTNILRGSKGDSLTVEEVQNVINVLVWDQKLEEVNGGYRTVRGVKFRKPGVEEDDEVVMESKRSNGLVEAPCGRCPVIDICSDTGPINAETCVYFEEWLGGRVSATGVA